MSFYGLSTHAGWGAKTSSSKNDNFSTKFKRRFFRLDKESSKMFYMENPEDEPKKAINLRNALIEDVSETCLPNSDIKVEQDKKQTKDTEPWVACIKITEEQPAMTTYCLFHTREQRVQWMRVLQEASGRYTSYQICVGAADVMFPNREALLCCFPVFQKKDKSKVQSIKMQMPQQPSGGGVKSDFNQLLLVFTRTAHVQVYKDYQMLVDVPVHRLESLQLGHEDVEQKLDGGNDSPTRSLLLKFLPYDQNFESSQTGKTSKSDRAKGGSQLKRKKTATITVTEMKFYVHSCPQQLIELEDVLAIWETCDIKRIDSFIDKEYCRHSPVLKNSHANLRNTLQSFASSRQFVVARASRILCYREGSKGFVPSFVFSLKDVVIEAPTQLLIKHQVRGEKDCAITITYPNKFQFGVSFMSSDQRDKFYNELKQFHTDKEPEPQQVVQPIELPPSYSDTSVREVKAVVPTRTKAKVTGPFSWSAYVANDPLLSPLAPAVFMQEKTSTYVVGFGDNQASQLARASTTPQTDRPLVAAKLGDLRIRLLSAAGSQAAAVTEAGRCVLWGASADEKKASLPRYLSMSQRIVQVSCGHEHVLVLDVHRTAWSWGDNKRGQLGRPGVTASDVPAMIDFPMKSKVVFVEAGAYHSGALTRDKGASKYITEAAITATARVFVWGSNQRGELGLKGTTDVHAGPSELRMFVYPNNHDAPITRLAFGNHTSCLTDAKGKLFAMGANDLGQLGLGDTGGADVCEPADAQLNHKMGFKLSQCAIGAEHAVGLITHSKGASCAGWGKAGLNGFKNPKFVPTPISALGSPLQVAAGDTHAVVLGANNTMFSFGSNDAGELGNGKRGVSALSKVKAKALAADQICAVTCGKSFSLALVKGSASRVAGEFGLANASPAELAPLTVPAVFEQEDELLSADLPVKAAIKTNTASGKGKNSALEAIAKMKAKAKEAALKNAAPVPQRSKFAALVAQAKTAKETQQLPVVDNASSDDEPPPPVSATPPVPLPESDDDAPPQLPGLPPVLPVSSVPSSPASLPPPLPESGLPPSLPASPAMLPVLASPGLPPSLPSSETLPDLPPPLPAAEVPPPVPAFDAVPVPVSEPEKKKKVAPMIPKKVRPAIPPKKKSAAAVVVPSASPKGDKAAAKRKTRTQLAQEMLATERSYLLSVERAVKTYLAPLRTILQLTQDKSIVSEEELRTLFCNLELILDLNTRFADDLEKIVATYDPDTSKLSPVFITYAPFFKLYTEYVGNYNAAMTCLDKLEKNNSKWTEFKTKVLQDKPNPSEFSLPALLICPIQRVPRYLLLLKEMKKQSPEDHVDYQGVEKAMAVIEGVAAHINKNMHAMAMRARIMELQDSFLDSLTLVTASRVLLKEGMLTKRCRDKDKRYQFLLCSDCVIYATKVGPKLKINRLLQINGFLNVKSPKIDLSKPDIFDDVKTSPEQDLSDREAGLCDMVLESEEKSFEFFADTRSEARAWLKAFQDAIEAQKTRIQVDSKLAASTVRQRQSSRGSIMPVFKRASSSPNNKEAKNACCFICSNSFSFLNRKHNCDVCGKLVCSKCYSTKTTAGKQKVCQFCMLNRDDDSDDEGDVTPVSRPHSRSLSNAKAPMSSFTSPAIIEEEPEPTPQEEENDAPPPMPADLPPPMPDDAPPPLPDFDLPPPP